MDNKSSESTSLSSSVTQTISAVNTGDTTALVLAGLISAAKAGAVIAFVVYRCTRR